MARSFGHRRGPMADDRALGIACGALALADDACAQLRALVDVEMMCRIRTCSLNT